MSRFGPRVGALAVLMGSAAPARAQPPPPAVEAPDATRRLEDAKDLFRKGVALLDAGNVERALSFFLRSREAVPSMQNTANAADCLDRLGRYDEAIEMYDELVASFWEGLDGPRRAAIRRTMAGLRAKLGEIALTSDVGGAVTIDGRPRGALVPHTQLRLPVNEGAHAVRVAKDGFVHFDRSVASVAGAEVVVEAQLTPTPPSDAEPHAETPPAVRRTGIFHVEAYGGYVGAATLGSDAERGCRISCSSVGGALVGLRAGYRFDRGLGLELTGGYALFGRHFTRVVDGHSGTAVADAYTFSDDVRVGGFFVGAGPTFASRPGLALGPVELSLLARTTVGVMFTAAADPMNGSLSVGSTSAAVAVANQNDIARSQALFVMPALAATLGWGWLRASLGLGVGFFPLTGPRLAHGETSVTTPSCPGAGCVGASNVVADERAYAPFVLFVPQVALGAVL